MLEDIVTAEKPQARCVYLCGDAKAQAAYQSYLDDTSVLIPIPPVLYRQLPNVVKRAILLDFPFYQFDASDAVGDATTQAGSREDQEFQGFLGCCACVIFRDLVVI